MVVALLDRPILRLLPVKLMIQIPGMSGNFAEEMSEHRWTSSSYEHHGDAMDVESLRVTSVSNAALLRLEAIKEDPLVTRQVNAMEKFGDVTLVFDGEKIRSSRTALATRSDFFNTLFSNEYVLIVELMRCC